MFGVHGLRVFASFVFHLTESFVDDIDSIPQCGVYGADSAIELARSLRQGLVLGSGDHVTIGHFSDRRFDGLGPRQRLIGEHMRLPDSHFQLFSEGDQQRVVIGINYLATSDLGNSRLQLLQGIIGCRCLCRNQLIDTCSVGLAFSDRRPQLFQRIIGRRRLSRNQLFKPYPLRLTLSDRGPQLFQRIIGCGNLSRNQLVNPRPLSFSLSSCRLGSINAGDVLSPQTLLGLTAPCDNLIEHMIDVGLYRLRIRQGLVGKGASLTHGQFELLSEGDQQCVIISVDDITTGDLSNLRAQLRQRIIGLKKARMQRSHVISHIRHAIVHQLVQILAKGVSSLDQRVDPLIEGLLDTFALRCSIRDHEVECSDAVLVFLSQSIGEFGEFDGSSIGSFTGVDLVVV